MVSSQNRRRILALWFPRLSTDRLKRRWQAQKTSGKAPEGSARTDPPAEAPPLVIAGKSGNALQLSGLDRKATALGLMPGMPLANARAMLPALTVMAENLPADETLLTRIADWCERYTPLVALQPPRVLLLDVTGAAHLFGGERAMLDQIRSKLSAQGFAVRGAIAGTGVAARALARHRDGGIAAPGTDAVALAPLPIEALDLDPVTIHAFRRAGLKTVGQVSARGRAELTARFGARMVFLLDQAQGMAEQPIAPRTLLPDYRAECRFADPVVTQEVVLSTLQSLAASLSAMLEARGEGARRLEARFFRADGAVQRLSIETGSPTRAPDIIVRLFRERLAALEDALDPGFGFDLIRLEAVCAERAAPESAGFDARAGQDREVRLLIDRLAARFGSHRILAFQPDDTHIPEAAWHAVPAQYAQEPGRGWVRMRENGEAPRRPLRLFAKPEPVSLLSAGDGAMRFRWRRAHHTVRLAEGPERIAMEWWRHQDPQASRDYFRVEDEKGRRFWLYRRASQTGLPPQWFVHGVFV